MDIKIIRTSSIYGPYDNFNEEKLLNKFEDYEFKDLQGSHWAPHIIHKSMWEKVG